MLAGYYSHNKLSMHNSIRKYFVGNLVTAAPPQYSSAIRLWLPGPTAPLVTELLQLPVPGLATVYRHISEMLT